METDTGAALEAAEASRFLRRREAGNYLKKKYGKWAPATLAKIACLSSNGPPMRSCGRAVLYEISELDKWALGQLSKPCHSTAAKRQPSAEHGEAV